MNERVKDFAIGLSIVGGGLCVFGAFYSAAMAGRMQKMIDASYDRISQMSHVDIDRRLVDQLVRKAVKEQAGTAVHDAALKVEHDLMADVKNRVKQAVQNQTANITKKVTDKVADEISDISRDDIMEDVIKEVTEKLVEKLSDDLDNEVGRVGKIYQGIAAALR